MRLPFGEEMEARYLPLSPTEISSLVERSLWEREVRGSIPRFPTMFDPQVVPMVSLNDRASAVRVMVGECSDLLDSLESALDSAEQVCPQVVIEEYANRLAVLAGKR